MPNEKGERNPFGMAPVKREGAMIDYLTSEEPTPERQLEILVERARLQAEHDRWRRSPAGIRDALLTPFRRAWDAFWDKDTGL